MSIGNFFEYQFRSKIWMNKFVLKYKWVIALEVVFFNNSALGVKESQH